MIKTLFNKIFRQGSVNGCRQSDDNHQEIQPISIKRYAAGKFCINANGVLPFRLIAVECLLQSCSIHVRFDQEQFCDLMRQNAVPEYLIQSYLESVTIADESYIDNPPIS